MNEESRKKQKARRQRGNCSRGRHMTIPLSTMYKVKERGKNRRDPRGRMREKRKEPFGKGVERQKVIKGRVDEMRSKGLESWPNCAAWIICDRLLPRKAKMKDAPRNE